MLAARLREAPNALRADSPFDGRRGARIMRLKA
jgi:hypothetical protein